MHWVLRPPPTPVTVYIRGPIRAIYNHIIFIIQLLLRGGQYPIDAKLEEIMGYFLGGYCLGCCAPRNPLDLNGNPKH